MSQYIAVYTMNRVTMLPKFKEIYPWCTGVFLLCEADDTNSDRPAGTLVRRSRGKHSPGDGNYFCSHVKLPFGANGFRWGDGLYLTSLERTKFTYRKEDTWVDFDGKSFNIEWCDNERNYYYEQYWFRSYDPSRRQVNYHITKWQQAGWPYNTTYEVLSAAAFAKDPIEQDMLLGSYYNGPHTPVAAAEFEQRYMQEQIDNDVLPNLSCYLNDAYIEAFNSLPSIQTNNIANVLSLYDFLTSLIESLSGRGIVNGIGSITDAWMGYRYQYSTTKADILELTEYTERMRNFRKLKVVTGHGRSNFTFGGDTYSLKCALQVRVDDYLHIYDAVEEIGIALDGYNVWDMIPYSFVVDWFLHIGDLLEKGRRRGYAMRLRPAAVWFSITHEFTNKSGCNQCDYYRFQKPVDLSALPASMLGQHQTKGSTWVKRAADAFCLLF